MKFYTVDVKNISCDVPRSNFDHHALDTLADMIIEGGGLIKPLVLKPTGLETFAVIDGYFEYYAAVTAREKNPRQCEMVNAFVISPKIEDLVLKQVEAITGLFTSNQPSTTQPQITQPQVTNLDSSRLNNLEVRLEKVINELKLEIVQERKRVDDKFKELSNNITKHPEKEKSSQVNDPLKLLNTLTQELYRKLKNSRIPTPEAKAKAIIEARNKKPNQEFEDYRDVKISVKGLGEMGILTIIDEWSRN
jgi:hypothetical protein